MNRSLSTCAKCFIPSCKNTTTNSRHKVFVLVKETLKRKWCDEANVEYQPKRRLLCCEDHLNLEEDLENYQYFKLMKGNPILKPNAKLRMPQDLPSCSKVEMKTITEALPTLKSLLLKPIENVQMRGTPEAIKQTEYDFTKIRPTMTSATTHLMKVDASTQCFIKVADQTTSTKDTINTTKHLPSLTSTSTSTTSSSCETTPVPSLYGCTSDTDSTIHQRDVPDHNARNQILNFISSDPKAYIGLPKQYFWLIKHIVNESLVNVTELDIIIVLYKIKLNDSVNRICDQFQISRVTYSRVMHNVVEVLGNFFQNLIYLPTLLQIKRNLPLAFKVRYSNVRLILDAFEIEIQKPHNPVSQAQTWSQYKNANTVKFLIGCTPNGFVSFLSSGYGGRISDKALVEKSKLIEFLPDNAVVMADRGFKEIEPLLSVKGIKLLRPPSVYASQTPTKEEVMQTKIVASLRVHIERVIRRVREFRFLKPHSVVSHKHVGYLNHVVLIACGLINLQNEIIKSD